MREEHQDVFGIWQKHLPEWGFEFSAILHLILALSALHLGHDQPELRDQYIRQADHHFTFGVQSVTAIISQLNPENCQMVYMAAVMICFIYFGRGPRPGEYLIFSEHGPAEWVVLMNGVKLILHLHHEKVFSGILEPSGEGISCEFIPAMRAELHEHRIHLEEVQLFLEAENAENNELDLKLAALHDLFELLYEMYEKISVGKSGVFLMDVLIGWIYRRPEEFVHLSEKCDPGALVIFAHWAVLLKYMETSWFMEGWAKHVLTGISGSLHVRHRSWIEWPLQKVEKA
ncbi:Protein of unknown function DUF3468 [Penicillium cataractarum]|uniref:Uncharacterized protein n=1 Tax=Penicillium cataractarum TaxID=2100454 RepID=A0A9W9RE28_9EURO|nr:Protein of unknown function DUF3468 [Penicillium cataractarum]KAJ5358471.1 Protein of unknown function DUF3468 [Penicillium cataractarum]